MSRTLRPEDNIAHYRIVSALASGGMGEVYLAQDRKLERSVALKILPPDLVKDTERVLRFEREAKALASLNHPNVAGIYGVEEQDGARYLILEYVEGETLEERLERALVVTLGRLKACERVVGSRPRIGLGHGMPIDCGDLIRLDLQLLLDITQKQQN